MLGPVVIGGYDLELFVSRNSYSAPDSDVSLFYINVKLTVGLHVKSILGKVFHIPNTKYSEKYLKYKYRIR